MSPFTPGPVTPTIRLIGVYFDGGVLRRLWAWPGQLGESCEPPGDALGWVLDNLFSRTRPWFEDGDRCYTNG